MLNNHPLLPPEIPVSPVLAAGSPPIPIVYEESESEKMSLRVYAAIHLRVPDSGLEWLDQMILRSRELDA